MRQSVPPLIRGSRYGHPNVVVARARHAGWVPDLTTRLMRRIRLDFPDHTKDVLDSLHGLDDLVVESRQDPERMFAAVLRCADRRLDGLREAAALARTDWRDLLMAADLGHGDWPDRLDLWLDAA